MNAASDGTTIRVAEGTYYETVVLTKSLTLEGGWNAGFTTRDWETYVTTIDAQRAGAVILVRWSVSPTIEGFVITGGDSSSPLGWGGGIWVYGDFIEGGGTTIIRHNVITNNVACNGSCQGHGGGIMVYVSTAIIEHNTIVSNVARTDSQGGEGGGIHIGWSAEATLTSNAIISNTAVFSTTGSWEGQGGGLYLYGSGVTLADNEIRGNVAAVKGTGRGGGLYAAGYHYDNRILSNTASISGTGYGGGMYAYWVQDFSNNLVQGNVASQHGDGTGGGIYANQLQDARHNVIVDNVATRGGGVYLGQYSNTEMRDNLIARNRATGSSLATGDGGGGIASVDDDAEIINNDILSNTAYGYGGGLAVMGGDQYVVRENTVRGNAASVGGGAFAYSSSGTIARNWIVSNTASTSGGGLHLHQYVTATLDANRVLSNTVTAGEGGGVCVWKNSAPVTLTNHIVARNSAANDGGGVYVYGSPSVRLINNTLVDNDRGSGQEGVALLAGSKVTMTNNIVAGHSVAVTVEVGSIAILSYNDYWGNTIGVAGQLSGTTDMTLNPQFEDWTAGDYHLTLDSPLIDQGDGGVNVSHDFEGDPRPRGSGIDVGADEAYRAESYVSESVGNDTTGDGSSGSPFATVTKGISETRTGSTVYVGRGRYSERITVTRSVNLLGGYHEDGWSRNIAACTTTLDAEGTGTVLVIRGEGTQATVEGFTITGGEATRSGGGLIIDYYAGATIRYNTITGNHAGNGGGGLAVSGDGNAESVVESNRIYNNVADGIFVMSPMAGKTALSPQQGPEPGGGLLLTGGPAQVVNNVIYSNTCAAGGDGMGLSSWGGPVQVYHNTVADNGGAGGVGAELRGTASEIYLYNNLIVGHGTGISVTAGAQVTWDYNGFYDNTAAYAPGLSGGAHDVSGDPRFADRVGGDYHIGPSSAMADRALATSGTDVGVSLDIDGDSRPAPAGTKPDLGADEVSQRQVYLPLVLRNS